MSETVIKVEGLSKQYRLGQIGTGTLSHDLNRWWHKARGKEDPYLKVGEVNEHGKKGNSKYVWALQDINFEVNQGDSLGIIGKNGAGKSTLLKILSRVTGPTIGGFKVKGRIASLLEVGTGFHPELTGRENIFMNGAILGMTKQEIKKKLEEIIAFSGIERYIDTPAKRYSSGMYVRLAFAVAAHLDSEILIADEVLAVGDAEFQKKCLGKMKDVASHGRTVLFVSHNMPAVKSLCNNAILIENGKLTMDSNVTDVVSRYMTIGTESNILKKTFNPPIKVNEELALHSFSINTKGSEPSISLPIDEMIEINVELETEADNSTCNYAIVLHFKDEEGKIIIRSTSAAQNINTTVKGKQILSCTIPSNFFNTGFFFINLLILDNEQVLFREDDILRLVLIDSKRELGSYMGRPLGLLLPNFTWNVKQSISTKSLAND
jgi:lipopolysaccharide transport system ATP-binding protein